MDTLAHASPLRDSTIFIEGAPRSGTTLLQAILACHPEIAATGTESHLFDSGHGVGALFDNLEGTPGHDPYLAGFLSRERLVSLVREFCDGVLEEMRSRIAPDARYVLEKTPASYRQPEVPLRRKLECYPDAWYVHIVRDAGAVSRSLQRQPRLPRGAITRRWRNAAVSAIRATFGELPRYIELSYEDLVADPASTAESVFARLGLETDEELREQVRLMARERFSQPKGESRSLRALGQRGWRLGQSLRARTLERHLEQEPETPAERLLGALVTRSYDGLDALLAPKIEFAIRSADGDLVERGEPARRILIEASHRLFSPPYLEQGWGLVSDGENTAAFFRGLHKEGRRVDATWIVQSADDLVVRIELLCVGALEGRPMRELALPPG